MDIRGDAWKGLRLAPDRRSPRPTRLASTLLLTAALLLAAAPGAMGLFAQAQKVIATDGAANDYFGDSVAMSGDRLLIGAWGDDDKGSSSGSAYMFERNPTGTWTQTQKLLANDGAAGDNLGASVAINGDRLVIGAWGDDDKGSNAGSAYVFERDTAGTWTQTQKLLASDGAAGDHFGWSAGISGDRLVLGARYDTDQGSASGSAYLFERNPTGTWTQTQKLLASDGAAGWAFGWSVAIDGDRLLIGADVADAQGTDAGSAYLFERNPVGTWIQAQKLLASDRAAYDYFGVSVAIAGERLVIGAHGDDDKGSYSGSAYVFERNPTGNWAQTQKLLASDGTENKFFGYSVATSGDRILIGAKGYVFERDTAGTWTQTQKLLAGNLNSGFGYSVAIDGDLLLLGHPYDDGNRTTSGGAYTFRVNHPPVAVITPVADAECADGGQTVTLDGTGSSDPDGDAITYAWTAPGITFSNPAGAKPSARFPLGSTTVTLKVTDPHGAYGTTAATVRVVDTLPPAVGITRPVPGATYFLDMEVSHRVEPLPILAVGALTVAAAAQDQCGIVQVDFVSTTGAAASDTHAPYTFVSDPAPGATGFVTVKATAHDLGGHTTGTAVAFVQVGTKV